jgi:ABC-type Co2+ transport system permease subunit
MFSQYFDVQEIVRRIIKYLIEGLMVAIAAYAIPKKTMNLEEIALLALVAAATFSILDTYLPSMGANARTGAGFGIGANIVGFPGGL